MTYSPARPGTHEELSSESSPTAESSRWHRPPGREASNPSLAGEWIMALAELSCAIVSMPGEPEDEAGRRLKEWLA